MKRCIIIALILIFLYLFCIKPPVFGESLRYDFFIELNYVIQNIKNDIDNGEENSIINKKYFEIIHLKNNFIQTCKDKTLRNYYNKILNKMCNYIVTAIFEKNTTWLNESIFLLQTTFGDYQNNYIYFIK